MSSHNNPMRAVKRPRSISPCLPSLEAKRSQPWRADGNVILASVEWKLFRVHRSTLVEYSPVFAGHFGFGPPGYRIDDCEAFLLTDTEHDLQHTLKAMLHRDYFKTQLHPTFEVTASVARLGKKYRIPSLLNDAMVVLNRAMPTSLVYIDGLLDGLAVGAFPPEWSSLPTLLGVLRLSRELNMPFLRPAAFFFLWHRIRFQDVISVRGLPCSDGIPQDLQVYLLGREKMIDLVRRTYKWAFEGTTCNQQPCRQYIQIAQHMVCHSQGHPAAALLRRNIRANICYRCLLAIEQMHDDGRRKAWQELPGILGLPGWEDLERTKSNYTV